MLEAYFLSAETYRLMRLMYNEEEFWEILEHMVHSDGWLILPFNDNPVLEKTSVNTIQAYNYRLN